MPEIKLEFGKTKKLDLSKFFDEEAYVYIKKIDRLTRKKLGYMQTKSSLYISAINADSLIKEKKINKDDKYTQAEILDMLEPGIKEECLKKDIEIEQLYLDAGVDPDNHNFTMNGEKIKLNSDFWDNIATSNPAVLYHVVNEIKKHNGDYVNIKKKKGRKLIKR